jgi:SPP1 family predicted phage head-tail adaptor
LAALRRIGRLRHKIQLQRPPTELDSLGRKDRDADWTTYRRPWAEVRELSGREIEIAHQINAQSSHLVTIRFLAQLEETHRIMFRGRTLEIKAKLDDDGTQRELRLLCGEQK